MASSIAASAEALNADSLRRDSQLERLKLFGLSSPAVLMVLIVLVIPVGWLFYLSFIGADGQFSLENYERMINRKSYSRIFVTTFQVSLLTTGICILIGYPLAYFMSQLPERLANLCLITVLVPFWTSLLVRTYAWLVLLQNCLLYTSDAADDLTRVFPSWPRGILQKKPYWYPQENQQYLL